MRAGSLLANWLDNEATDAANQQRLQRPESLGNFGLMFRGADERFGFIANYRVARDSIDAGNVAVDDYEVLDLSMTFDATESFQFFARIAERDGRGVSGSRGIQHSRAIDLRRCSLPFLKGFTKIQCIGTIA